MTQPKFKIKKGDLVFITTGRDKGKRGIVKKVFLDKAQIIVENINVVIRNAKPDYRNPQGSFKKELPISISNASLIDPSIDKPAKVGYKLDGSGKKVRYFKKRGTVL